MSNWFRLFCVVLLAGPSGIAVSNDTLQSISNTSLLTLEEPLDVVMVRGIGAHAEKELQDAIQHRTAPWLPGEPDSTPGMTKADARHTLRGMIGAEEINTLAPLWIKEKSNPDQVTQVQLHVRDGITLTAFRFEPSQANTVHSIEYILLSDPDDFPASDLIERILQQGHTVYCPVLIDRRSDHSGHPDIRATNMPHREYVYRAGFNVGRHPVGYEVEKVLQLARRLKHPGATQAENRHPRVALIGIGEGGLLALHAAALGEDVIDAVAVCGYFGPRENVWQEPIYRNIFGQLTLFGDAELASLIAPRPLIIESGLAPEVDGPPAPKSNEAPFAAPGRIVSPSADAVKQEYDKAKAYYKRINASGQIHLTPKIGKNSGTPETLMKLQQSLGDSTNDKPSSESVGIIAPEELAELQQISLQELIEDTQRTLRQCDNKRAKLWREARSANLEQWNTLAPKYRELVHSTFIGKLPHPAVPLNPHSRKVIDEPTHVGYEITLDVCGEGAQQVIAGGILLLPKGLKQGEKRPVVVCQHGLEGTPMDTITTDETTRAWRAYKGFATQLVKRGFIVYAPQNPYRGYHDFRVIQRKANPLGRSLFSYIIEQHRQTLNWLATLPNVDRDRIGFYGLSYGGKTAMRVPQLLPPSESEVGYCLSICSADFNDWIRKNASTEDRYSYVFTSEYEIFEWDMGHVANYAELGLLMMPRPFMVERGHHDGVAPDEWVAYEYAKIRRDYTLAGIGDRTEIEWFNGPHSINGDGTFRFLHKHLNWPEPSK